MFPHIPFSSSSPRMDYISRLTWFSIIVSEKCLINARIADVMHTNTHVNLGFTSCCQSQKYISCRVYLTKGDINQKLNLAFISLNLARFSDPSQTLSLQTYKRRYVMDVINFIIFLNWYIVTWKKNQEEIIPTLSLPKF